MAALIISTTLVLLIGYLIIDDIEYSEDSILAHLGLRLFHHSDAKKAEDPGKGS